MCLFATLWTIAHHAPLSIWFCRQENWSELPCPPPGDLPNPGFKPTFLNISFLAGRSFTTSPTYETCINLLTLELINFSSEQSNESRYSFPILLMRKLRHRDVKWWRLNCWLGQRLFRIYLLHFSHCCCVFYSSVYNLHDLYPIYTIYTIIHVLFYLLN